MHLYPIESALRSVLRVSMHKPYKYPTIELYYELDVPDLATIYAEELLFYRYTQRGDTTEVYHTKGTRLAADGNIKQHRINLSIF